MEYTDIPQGIVHQDWVPEVNKRFKQILGYDGDIPPENEQTIAELRAEILALLSGLVVYDQAGFHVGKPDAGKKVFSLPLTRNLTLPANCAGSKARVSVTATATAVFSIKKNGFEIGTITWGAGVAIGAFDSLETEFSINDILEITAPDPQDATLADPCWNFKINLTIEIAS